jgi:DNA adenine methylase Dam
MITEIEIIILDYSLGKTNQAGFLALREYYNNMEVKHPMHLYMLICHAFNNQIRFNSKGGYSMPFGKDRSSFNPALQEKFCSFVKVLQDKNIIFSARDFRDVKLDNLHSDDFVYCDPPYLNTDTTYTRCGGWTQQHETDLLKRLDILDRSEIKFALSNNLRTNPNLEKWAVDRGYNIHHLNGNYSNCNYHKKDKTSKDREVLIKNY